MRKQTGVISATRRFEFAYAHQLPDYQGDCCRVHGHNGIVEVTVSRSVPDFLAMEESAGQVPDWDAGKAYCGGLYGGMVCDFKQLKEAVSDILGQWDHTMLNQIVPFDRMAPTAENMCLVLASELSLKFGTEMFPGDLRVTRIRVYETTNSYAEWEA